MVMASIDGSRRLTNAQRHSISASNIPSIFPFKFSAMILVTFLDRILASTVWLGFFTTHSILVEKSFMYSFFSSTFSEDWVVWDRPKASLAVRQNGKTEETAIRCRSMFHLNLYNINNQHKRTYLSIGQINVQKGYRGKTSTLKLQIAYHPTTFVIISIDPILLPTMMADIMDEKDIDETRYMSSNLELITLYIYRDCFVLQPNAKTTKIRSNLIITRKTGQIQEKNKNEPIDQTYTEKLQYSAFMGILTVLSRSYLFLIDNCEKVCSINAQDIFEVRSVALIPCQEEQNNELQAQIQNYILYLKNCLIKEGYYFSYDYDLSLSRQAYAKGYPTRGKYHWNLNMSRQLLQLQDKGWFVGLMQGSIKYFKVFLQGKKLEYYLITRRSWKVGGTRYNSRGIDSKGHVANFCETEQLISVGTHLFSHVQIRGSAPAFWKQSGIYAEVQFYANHEQNRNAFERHFKKLQKYYANIFCLNLLSKQKTGQYAVTLYYEQLIKELGLPYLKYEFYDFHFACKGQKFERSDYLIDKVAPVNKYFGYYSESVNEKMVAGMQKGVFRTNCLDCLDRTNLVQSKVAYEVLGSILTKCGFTLNSLIGCDSVMKATHGCDSTNILIINLKNAWADNGDMISKHYTGTGSTHTNITRTGRRDLKGIMDHGLKTLGRFYKQYMEDNYKQEVIDLLIGQHTETINLAEFQTRLKNVKEDQLEGQEFVEL